jgi:hypothetical protein
VVTLLAHPLLAVRLRTSLTTIARYAQQLARSRDSDLAPPLAADIASEAASLDRHIAGFLAEKHNAPGIDARASAAGRAK